MDSFSKTIDQGLDDDDDDELTWDQQQPIYNFRRRGGFSEGDELQNNQALHSRHGNPINSIRLRTNLIGLSTDTSSKSLQIEYFKPLKSLKHGKTEKGMGFYEKLRTKSTNVITRDKAIEVRAEDANYDELGMVNFYGYVSK